jgi:hypothetical protein
LGTPRQAVLFLDSCGSRNPGGRQAGGRQSLKFYNNERPHQGCPNMGSRPIVTVGKKPYSFPSATAWTASMILAYPVQRQRLPAR